MAAGLWLAMNAVLWYCLLEVPPFKSLPPVPIGVAGIFVNLSDPAGTASRHAHSATHRAGARFDRLRGRDDGASRLVQGSRDGT
ncbi:MAG TPA: hypothetical protein VGG63_20010 [Steroidobacteraceae bacterium]